MTKTYKIEVDCANCAREMEEAAAKISGVQSVTVNFMAQKMVVWGGARNPDLLSR